MFVDSIFNVDVSLVNFVDELVDISVLKVDISSMEFFDEFLNGHCENKYENEKYEK